MVRYVVSLLALLLPSAVSREAHAQVGYIYNKAETPLIRIATPNGSGMLYQTGMALERFDGTRWVELLRSDGRRAVISEGQCWSVPDRTRALGYRLRPQFYDASLVAQPIDCANPEPFFAKPACPTVVTDQLSSALHCLTWIALVDPGTATSWSAPAAPQLRP